MDSYHFFSILGMSLVTLLTRAFFLFADESFKLPAWLERALVYAPIAALSAVIAPEVFVVDHHFIASLWNAKLIASLCCVIFFYAKRKHSPSVLQIIVLGLFVYLPLHLIFEI
jgi:branched-subunit amino acid transport protein